MPVTALLQLASSTGSSLFANQHTPVGGVDEELLHSERAASQLLALPLKLVGLFSRTELRCDGEGASRPSLRPAHRLSRSGAASRAPSPSSPCAFVPTLVPVCPCSC